MWIGYPGDVRSIRDPASGVELSTSVNTSTEVTISGAVQAASRRRTPRTWKLTWNWLGATDSDWLRDLARRTVNAGPFVLIDASTRNYLAPAQSVGRGEKTQWSVSAGTLATQTDGSIQWTQPGS